MAAIAHDCPHCGTKQVGFKILKEYEYRRPQSALEIHAFVSCGNCGRTAVAVFDTGEFVDTGKLALNLSQNVSLGGDHFRIVEFHPKPEVPTAPEHVPENVETFYLEAVEDVKARPNAAGAMFRKALETGLKAVERGSQEEPTGPRKKLYERINALAEKGTITKDLAEWSHHIRLEGADAAHEEDPFTREEAERLHRFTELVMMYLFTLPGMLKEWRAKEDEGPSSGE